MVGWGGDGFLIMERSRIINSSKKHKYYILNSGVRVYSKDISVIDDRELEDNMITAMNVTSDNNYTYVTFSSI